jgi:2-dehydropantoate 2-reductase
MHIGSLFGQSADPVAPLAESLTRGGIPCIPTDTIAADLWAKMLFNCTLNPLGAILDVPYGALGAQPSTVALMNRIADEIFAVCHAMNMPLHWPSCSAFLEDFYGQQVPATANHHSSTLQDIKAGKRTEIDALNGQVITLAERHGVSVPYNQCLYRLVKFIESSTRDIRP